MATPAQQALIDLWEEHTRCEFEAKDVDGTMATMREGAHILNMPVMTGGDGLEAVREFYSKSFIPQLPLDTETVLVSRTVGDTQIVDELIFKFTHTVSMDWMLPGIEPTGKRVEIGLVVILGIHESKVTHEHIYWDQASVLVQVGLIDPANLPVCGIESARKMAEYI
jgi:carboxymethylenebutenolidase